ncbi:MAG: hypothetical protein NZ455_01720 [Bacteroidia bacterium]|nr:hypothetical protein [Bacteroidia bacterium]MDW8347112.1 hypothetical protein [Bacteroidia bacterium]
MRHAEGKPSGLVRSPSPTPLAPQPGGGRVGRSTVSPQHADLAHPSRASRGQGHAQKSKISHS